MIEGLLTLVVAALLVVGSAFALAAAIGIVRLPDLYTRMHAASKAGSVGSGLMLIAIAIHSRDLGVATRSLAGVVFFLLTAPISAHLLAKAAYAVGYRLTPLSVHDDMASPVHDGED
ncbi:MAG: monovalent cation/H(+) antiporter subunit G [Pararhizobium sp.]